MALTGEQRKEREAAIGSSDAPVAVGVSPYKDPLTLYHQLTGDLPRYSEEETFDQMAGSKFEPIIAEIGAEMAGVQIRRAPVKVHRDLPWMIAHLDFEIINHPRGPGVCEIKRRAGERFFTLPDDITIQVAHQLAVTNRAWGLVFVQFDWGKPAIFPVERDRGLEDNLIHILTEFMRAVQERQPPPPTWGHHTSALMKALYPYDTGRVIELPATAVAICRELLATKQQIKAAESWEGTLESKLQYLLTDASEGHVGDYVATWKRSRDGEKFDLERFKAENPEEYRKYVVPREGSRRLLLKQGGKR